MRGGAREGSGRKSKVEEQKAVNRILLALKQIYKTECEEESITNFLIDFADTKEGMKFIAEHILGKPDQNINANINNIPQIIFQDVSGEEIKEDVN